MEETRNSPYSDGEDRIGRLPDELIHYILSFIDTKYAVQTSILSKRWIHIWKSLPFLKFIRSSFSNENTKMFIEFVYMVFALRDKTDIRKFSVDWDDSLFDSTVITNVNRWSLSAVRYGVQEISIIIEQLHNSAYEIPHRLLNCESLRKLEIQGFHPDSYVDITLPRSINLPQLKELTMYGFSISNLELSQRFFSSCPVLETLNTVGSDIQNDNNRNFKVDSLSLKKFAYTCSHKHLLPENNNVTNIIKLCAPNLEDFFCSFFLTPDYSLEISSPLSGVSFQVRLNAQKQIENAETYETLPSEEKAVYAKRMLKYLGAVSMVRDMGLSSGFLEVLSEAPDLLSCQQLRLCNLQVLWLLMWLTRGSLRAIAYLLSISPNVTRLFLKSKQSALTGVGDDWEIGLPLRGMLSHLKYVELEEAEGCDAELKLLSFLLKNAKVLEKVVIFFGSRVDLPDKSRVRQVEQFKDKLRAVPTTSLSMKMVFH